MSRKLEQTLFQRYASEQVVDHLASNYVMGLLSPRVKRRVDTLRAEFDYRAIDQRINYWENKLSPLNDHVPELAPLPETWQDIQSRLDIGQSLAKKHSQNSRFSWLSFSMPQWAAAFSVIICVVIGVKFLPPQESLGALSYVAVLEDDNQRPQVVAATYGDSKKLVLDILTLPDIDSEQSFELWVTSKTDNQTRSLGEIPQGVNNFDRQLSDAEWRLIADSSFLVISVEDAGGSALGEPSDEVISKGLCIRLASEEARTRV